MNLCAKAEKSTGDARRLLFRWGVDKAEHGRIIARLVGDGFIDDRRYAGAFVRDKVNFSRWGVYKIRAALRNKQIAEEIINEALTEVDSPGNKNMEEKLLRQLESKMRTVKYNSAYDLRGKLLRYGTGLGFDYENVAAAVDGVMKNIKENE